MKHLVKTVLLSTVSVSMVACSANEAETPTQAPASVEIENTVMPVEPAPRYVTLLSCDAIGSSPSFERSYIVLVDNGRLSFTRGTAGEAGYESWAGDVGVDGAVKVTGTYVATPGQPGDVSLSGTLTSETLNLSGMRGPRDCTATGRLPDA